MTLDQLRGAAAGDSTALQALSTALMSNGGKAVATAVADLGTDEAVALILRLKPKRARRLLGLLGDAEALAVLRTLDNAVAEGLLDAAEEARVARILAKLPSSEAVEFLAEAPRSLAMESAAQLGSPKALMDLLQYGTETAGAFMSRRFFAAPLKWTLGEVIDAIRSHADGIDKLDAVYAIDDDGRLRGFLKPRQLLLLPADRSLADAVDPNPVTVNVMTDRGGLAELAERRRLAVLPVVDGEGRLLGHVTAKELLAIERAEADEDAKLRAGVAPESSSMDGPLRIVPHRLPWLAAGLIGSSTAAVVVGSYEDALTEAAILATLIPIVMSLAGNVGIQASTVTVQAQTSGAFWIGDLGGRVLREMGGALLNGLVIGILVGAGILALADFAEIERPMYLALTALLTLMAVTLQAATVGSVVPVLLERLGFNPAVATGVFITTSNDVIGVLVYFLIASALYL